MKLHKSEIASIKIARNRHKPKWWRFEVGFHEGIIEDTEFHIGPSFNVDEAFEKLRISRQDFVKNRDKVKASKTAPGNQTGYCYHPYFSELKTINWKLSKVVKEKYGLLDKYFG